MASSPEIPEAMVEAVAEAMFERLKQVESDHTLPWSELIGPEQQPWLDDAAAVLTAALRLHDPERREERIAIWLATEDWNRDLGHEPPSSLGRWDHDAGWPPATDETKADLRSRAQRLCAFDPVPPPASDPTPDALRACRAVAEHFTEYGTIHSGHAARATDAVLACRQVAERSPASDPETVERPRSCPDPDCDGGRKITTTEAGDEFSVRCDTCGGHPAVERMAAWLWRFDFVIDDHRPGTDVPPWSSATDREKDGWRRFAREALDAVGLNTPDDKEAQGG